MKVLMIDYDYYLFPEDYSNLDEFINYVNENLGKFIPLHMLQVENCVAPYFIKDDITKCYLNFRGIEKIYEINSIGTNKGTKKILAPLGNNKLKKRILCFRIPKIFNPIYNIQAKEKVIIK